MPLIKPSVDTREVVLAALERAGWQIDDVQLDHAEPRTKEDTLISTDLTPYRVTGYDVRIEVRYSGESTTAEGWIELDGKRYRFQAEADVSSRGTTYTVGDKQFWWDEVPWLDSWFEDLWLDAAAHAGYSLDNSIDFDGHLTSESEEEQK
jgi:hypothetical protein